MSRDSFIFYASFYDSMEKMPAKDKLELLDAICQYALKNQEPKFSGLSIYVWPPVKAVLDANNNRFKDDFNPLRNLSQLRFIFYHSFYEAYKHLTEEQKVALFESICAYGLYQQEPDNNAPEIQVLMNLIKPQMHLNYCSDSEIQRSITNLLNDSADEI